MSCHQCWRKRQHGAPVVVLFQLSCCMCLLRQSILLCEEVRVACKCNACRLKAFKNTQRANSWKHKQRHGQKLADYQVISKQGVKGKART